MDALNAPQLPLPPPPSSPSSPQGHPPLASTAANGASRKRKRDDDEGEEVKERQRTLVALWNEPGGAAQNAQGETVAGRRRISGRQKIANKAKKTLARAQKIANPAAEALGLGPCLTDIEAVSARGNRPIAFFEVLARSGQGKGKRNGSAMLYHVTWCDANDQPPPRDLEYSHRCHNRTCLAPKHGVWETAPKNRGRDRCESGDKCEHSPVCIALR